MAADKELPDISVGDFAANILKDMKSGKAPIRPALKESTIQSAGGGDVPDVSRVKVDDSFLNFAINAINPGSVPTTRRITIEESVEDEPEVQDLTEATKNLLAEFSSLINKAKKIIEELTAGTTGVGNIGVNTLGPAKKKKKKKTEKDNPWAICHNSTGPKKTSKFERCVQKVKKN